MNVAQVRNKNLCGHFSPGYVFVRQMQIKRERKKCIRENMNVLHVYYSCYRVMNGVHAS